MLADNELKQSVKIMVPEGQIVGFNPENLSQIVWSHMVRFVDDCFRFMIFLEMLLRLRFDAYMTYFFDLSCSFYIGRKIPNGVL